LEPFKEQDDVQKIIDAVFFQDVGDRLPSDVLLYLPLITADVNSRKPEKEARDFSKPLYMVWKVEDRPAKDYQKIEQLPPAMREQIVKAWKMQKARALARKAADNFANEVSALAKKELQDAKNQPAFLSGIRDLAAKNKFTNLGDIVKIAKLQSDLSKRGRGQYSGPKIDSKELLYTTAKFGQTGMAEQLIALQDKQVGEVAVVPNVPKSHFYVSILVNKDEPGIDRFFEIYTRSNEKSGGDPLYFTNAREKADKDFRKDLSERLKAETGFKETETLLKMKNKTGDEPSPE
jgi:hypothetical protein